jgi:hypothetical protein
VLGINPEAVFLINKIHHLHPAEEIVPNCFFSFHAATDALSFLPFLALIE